MNIFILDNDPIKAAQLQCDRHVTKMALESTQLLSNALAGPYKQTHLKHPCSTWVTKSANNFEWLKQHAIALCEEYTHRYGRRHRCQDIIECMFPNGIPSKGLTDFPQAMPDEFKNNDPVIAYQEYYKTKKHFAKYTNREIPDFLK